MSCYLLLKNKYTASCYCNLYVCICLICVKRLNMTWESHLSVNFWILFFNTGKKISNVSFIIFAQTENVSENFFFYYEFARIYHAPCTSLNIKQKNNRKLKKLLIYFYSRKLTVSFADLKHLFFYPQIIRNPLAINKQFKIHRYPSLIRILNTCFLQ